VVINVKVQDLEDQLLNPLNSILLLVYGQEVYKQVEKEVRRVVGVLEKEHLINKRRHI
jgi:hypothetical protein